MNHCSFIVAETIKVKPIKSHTFAFLHQPPSPSSLSQKWWVQSTDHQLLWVSMRHGVTWKTLQTIRSQAAFQAELPAPPEPALPGAVLCLWTLHHAGRHQHYPGGSFRFWHLRPHCQPPHHHRAASLIDSPGLLHSLLCGQQEAPSPHGPQGKRRWEVGADADGDGGVWDGDQRAHAARHHSCPTQPYQLPLVLSQVQLQPGSHCSACRMSEWSRWAAHIREVWHWCQWR